MNSIVMRGLLAFSVPLALVGGAEGMQEFMESDRVPGTDNVMRTAGRTGHGDAKLGMTRMVEMMGSMSGG
ncbi:MAG TPA: hypothetical protein VFV05_02925, partial [Methylomirabilota bacterium]|nr:hypothetical protein [Methylomirabilota bacterium]